MSIAADLFASVIETPPVIDVEEPLALAGPSLPDFAPYFQRPEFPREYVQMEESAYHAYPAVNATLLKNPTQAEMLHYFTPQRKRERRDKGKILGTLTHAVVLEPHKFSAENWQRYFVECPTATLDSKTADEVQDDNPDKLLVTGELLDAARRIRAEALENHPKAMSLLASPDAMREATGIVRDPVTGVRRKIRVDFLPRSGPKIGNYMVDLKTTRKPLSQFHKEAWNLGYWLQAAWYLDTHELLTGLRPRIYYWLVMTNTEPFMCDVFWTRNRHPGDPVRPGDLLYEESSLGKARRILGLDPSEQPGRLNMFVHAAKQTAALDRASLTPVDVRRIWSAYESEEGRELL